MDADAGAQAAAALGQFFRQDGVADGIEAAATVFGRKRRAQEALGGHLGVDFVRVVAVALPLLDVGLDVFLDEAAGHVRDHALFVAQVEVDHAVRSKARFIRVGTWLRLGP